MMRDALFYPLFPAKCGQECSQITGIFILLKHDFNGGKRKSGLGKRNKRPKENAESEKRMSILLLFWEMTELPLVNR